MKKSDAPEALLAAASYQKPMTRTDVTELIVMARLKKGLSWAKLAKAIGQSKEWTTAALLGQMQMTKEQAEKAGKLLGRFPLHAKGRQESRNLRVSRLAGHQLFHGLARLAKCQIFAIDKLLDGVGDAHPFTAP